MFKLKFISCIGITVNQFEAPFSVASSTARSVLLGRIPSLAHTASSTINLFLFVHSLAGLISVSSGGSWACLTICRTRGPVILRYQPPFRTVRARIAVALVVFIKTPINHIFFKSLIIPDYGFELTKSIYLNVFRNWNALCKSTRLYKSCSTPAGNKRKKTINTAFASQHVPPKNRVSDF